MFLFIGLEVTMTNSWVVLENKLYLGTAGSLYSITNLCCTLLQILLIYLLNIFCYITQVLKAVPKTTKNKSTSKENNYIKLLFQRLQIHIVI